MVAQSKGQLQSSSATKIGESVLIQKSLTCLDFVFATMKSAKARGNLCLWTLFRNLCLPEFLPMFFFPFGESWWLLNLH